ncbi:hypothetical protein Tco_1256660 [Tanacetum coccineum]
MVKSTILCDVSETSHLVLLLLAECDRLVSEPKVIENYSLNVLMICDDYGIRMASMDNGGMLVLAKKVLEVFVKFRVNVVVFWVTKGISAHVSAGTGSVGSIRRIQGFPSYCESHSFTSDVLHYHKDMRRTLQDVLFHCVVKDRELAMCPNEIN